MLRWSIPILLFIALLFSSPFNYACAVWLDLTEEQIKEAVEYGKANKDLNMLEFLDEWVVVRKAAIERVGINTQFSLIALAARAAAKDNRELTPDEIEKSKAQAGGLLSFSAVLYGRSATFAQSVSAVLECGEKIIAPVRNYNQPRALPRGWSPGKPQLFCAVCEFDFPDFHVNPQLVITLVIFSEIASDRRFLFELSAMR